MLEGKRFSGARIRQARHERGLTQAQLARAAGTSERNIIRWENNQNQPRVENVLRIADVTGKSLDFFIEGDVGDRDAPVTREQRLVNVGLAVEALLVPELAR